MALHEQAMLANLTISQWDARKFDKTATKDVETKHAASNAGRFNKLLIDETALAPISKIAAAMRQHHYKMTMPWGDNGDRLLPSKLFLQYTKDMRDYQSQLKAAVSSFVTAYPTLVVNARKRLGTLYEPSDYPLIADIGRRFGAEFSFSPVPTARDFRVDVAEEDAVIIRADMERRLQQRQQEALKDIFERIKLFVTRVRDTLSQPKPRIYDSLMGNIKELASMLPAFNITGDPKLAKLEQDLKAMIHTPDSLRNQVHIREKVARQAEAVLAELP